MNEKKPRINGSAISEKDFGKVVTLLGRISGSVDHNGRGATFKSAGDDADFELVFSQPVSSTFPGYVEINAKVFNKVSLLLSSHPSAMSLVERSDEVHNVNILLRSTMCTWYW